jgi:Asp-tRNA(Asn)/Glu-tRNA(Gln) amidotransferase A subunit family amidase
LEEARIADQERMEARERGKMEELPWLHGIPISVKEQVKIKN